MTTYHSDDCASGIHDMCGRCECLCHGFTMTKEEVEYFLNNIKHEYLNKDHYYETISLINRMQAFLDAEK